MPDTTQQHSADAQQKPREEDLLQEVKSTALTCHFAEWATDEANHRTVVGVPQNAAEGVPPVAVSNDANKKHSNEREVADDDITPARTQGTVRIFTPHPHDVLSRRGFGPLYHHAGNVHFRAWVAERKTSYHLASNEKKARLTREVIALVKNQNPPGRILKRDPAHAGWWIEADDGRVWGKIRHALWGAADHSTAKNGAGNQEEFERPAKRVRFDGNGEAALHQCNAGYQAHQPGSKRTETSDEIASVRTEETANIRTPHPHGDILGRGGMSNHHPW
jgi:hypothetical protein